MNCGNLLSWKTVKPNEAEDHSLRNSLIAVLICWQGFFFISAMSSKNLYAVLAVECFIELKLVKY